jgi:hypothetical protein
VVAYIALFVALGGSSYAAITISGKNVKDSSLTGRDVRNNSLTGRDVRSLGTADVKNGALLADDFAPGQLSAGPKGEQGLKGDRGDTGAAGATNVVVRWSLQGLPAGGLPPSGNAGGNGGSAACQGNGCVARGGNGGDANGSNAGGFGGSASCVGAGCLASGGSGGAGSPGGGAGNAFCSGNGCTQESGAAGGGPVAQPAQLGEGATVGERAECLPGERAVGGGVRGANRSAIVFRNHPVALDSQNASASDPPADGEVADAWYVEVYNQSKAGEGRQAQGVSFFAYVLCASP